MSGGGPLMWFFDGGVWMWAILGGMFAAMPLVLISFVLAGASRMIKPLLWPARIVCFLIALFSLNGLIFGCAGYASGVRMTDEAVAYADPQYRDELQAAGYEMSKYPLYFGGMTGGFLAIPAWLAVLITLPGHSDELED